MFKDEIIPYTSTPEIMYEENLPKYYHEMQDDLSLKKVDLNFSIMLEDDIIYTNNKESMYRVRHYHSTVNPDTQDRIWCYLLKQMVDYSQENNIEFEYITHKYFTDREMPYTMIYFGKKGTGKYFKVKPS